MKNYRKLRKVIQAFKDLTRVPVKDHSGTDLDIDHFVPDILEEYFAELEDMLGVVMSHDNPTTSKYAELGRALKAFEELEQMGMEDGCGDYYHVSCMIPAGLKEYLYNQKKMAMEDSDSDYGQCDDCCGPYSTLHKDDPRVNADWITGVCSCDYKNTSDVKVYEQR